MKFLEDRELAQLNNFLSHVNLGDHEVTGQLENYSCTFIVCFAFATLARLVRHFLFLFSASNSMALERTRALLRRETRGAHFLFTLSPSYSPLLALLHCSNSFVSVHTRQQKSFRVKARAV